MDRVELITRLDTGEFFEFYPFYGHHPAAQGIDASCLSQWFAAPFTIDGVRYATAEHFMMAEKARLFGDGEVLARILAAAGPAEAKRLGRAVRGYDDARWSRERRAAVTRGNVAKFEQHRGLGAFLLGTGNAVLIEASPRDTIWGIGLGVGSPLVTEPRRWRGQNLLGFALMDVRAELR